MPDAVETMAYTNETPWHGLGTYVAEAPDVPTMLELAELNWRVEKRPIYHTTSLEEKYTPIERFYALVRDKDEKVFDIAGEIYTPCQNEEAFEFFVEFVEGGDATMETAGSLRGGKYVWGLANLKAGFKLANDDQVELMDTCSSSVPMKSASHLSSSSPPFVLSVRTPSPLHYVMGITSSECHTDPSSIQSLSLEPRMLWV
jgi:hypothetical protein